MNLYQAYLNWRLNRTRVALARAEDRFYDSSKKMKKVVVRGAKGDECIVCRWDAKNLSYLCRIGELKEKESYLVEKLSSVGGD